MICETLFDETLIGVTIVLSRAITHVTIARGASMERERIDPWPRTALPIAPLSRPARSRHRLSSAVSIMSTRGSINRYTQVVGTVVARPLPDGRLLDCAD